MEPRIAKIRQHMAQHGIQASLFFSSTEDPNFFWLTGSNAGGILIIPANSRPFIITNVMEDERLKEESNVKDIVISEGKRVSEIIKARIPGIRRIGINHNSMTVAMLHNFKQSLRASYVDVGDFCNLMRAVKSPEEQAAIREACKLSVKIYKEIINSFSFETELHLAGFIDSRVRHHGYEPAFPTIVASSANASKPHHTPTHSPLESIMIDFGVRVRGYSSDLSRSFFVGKPSKEEIEAYKAVAKTLDAIISKIRPGVKCADLAILGEKMLRGHQAKVLHSFGHGIGIQVHESPIISEFTKDVLQEGMVVAIEPALYLRGKFGIRIEDDVLVTKHGAEILTM